MKTVMSDKTKDKTKSAERTKVAQELKVVAKHHAQQASRHP